MQLWGACNTEVLSFSSLQVVTPIFILSHKKMLELSGFYKEGLGWRKPLCHLKKGPQNGVSGSSARGWGAPRAHEGFLSRKPLDPCTEFSAAAKASNVLWPPAGDLCSKELRAVKQAELLSLCWVLWGGWSPSAEARSPTSG